MRDLRPTVLALLLLAALAGCSEDSSSTAPRRTVDELDDAPAPVQPAPARRSPTAATPRR